jgi:quercetin dioxygenase-like cupin family protein
MAISHALSGQVIELQPLGSRLHSEKTVALFKAHDLELIRLVLPQGKSMPAHKVAGEITVQCIEGQIDVTVQGHSHVLSAGQLLYLSGGVLHGVVALQDASALITIALRK